MSLITKSARYQECQVRIPGVCRDESDTVILAHRPGGGIAMKNPDYQGSFCCWRCHEVVDGRAKSDFSQVEIECYFADGVFRTQEILRDIGLIKIKGGKK